MHRTIKAALIVLVSMSIFGFLCNVGSILRFPYAVDYGEAPLLDQATRLMSRQPLYKSDYSSSPYVITNYPPLFVIFLAGVSKLTGANLLLYGRVISVMASIASAALLAILVRSLTNNDLSAFIASGLFLGHPYVITWSSLARVDLLALFFCLLALCIVYHRWFSWRWMILAILFFLASIYTRQSYMLAGPLAAFTWLWWRDRRRAMFFAGILFVAVLGLFIGIEISTHGGFSRNIIWANINRFDLGILSGMFQHFLLIWPVIILGCLGFSGLLLTYHFRRRTVTHSPFIFPGLVAFCLGAFISALTIGKVGSGVNYFLELIAACTILSAVAIDALMLQPFRHKPIMMLAITGQLVWLLAGAYIQFTSASEAHWERLEWYQQLADRVQVAAGYGPVLSDDYLGMVVQAGQPMVYQPFEYGQLYQAGLWNPEPLAEQIQAGEFSLIVIGGDTLDKPCCWPPELIQAIQESYLIDYQPEVILCTPIP